MAFDRKLRNAVLLAKVESTSGTDSTPTGASNAMLTSGDMTLTPIDAEQVPRNLIRGYFGAPETLLGATWMSVQFSVEAAGSGTAGTAPAWGGLVRGCGFAETVSAGSRVEYTPVSTSLTTLSLYAFTDGLLHKFIGAAGTMDASMTIGGLPLLTFNFIAAYLAPTATANATPTLTSWQIPRVVNNTNTTQLVIGGTYSAGVISGGTSYTSGGLEFTLGNQLSRLELVGAKEAGIVDRAISGTVRNLDFTAAQEAAAHGFITDGTKRSIGMSHGTTAGQRVLTFFPTARFTGLANADYEGVITSDMTFEAPPSSGNDDMRLVAL